MTDNMLLPLEQTAARIPEQTAFCDDRETLTYADLMQTAQRIGTALTRCTRPRQPVALLLDPRSIRNIPALYGALYAGCPYAPMDISMPPQRLLQLLELLQPAAILTDERGAQALAAAGYTAAAVLSYEAASACEADMQCLARIREQARPEDAMSILYTSGSTGVPKGSVQTHSSYSRWTAATIRTYSFDSSVVFGNQSPFFYANSIIDIFPPVALGAVVYLLPAGVLTFPKKFIECMNEHHVTELTMTPSSFIGICNAGVLTPGCLPELRYGIMSGESMPWAPLEQWMQATPRADWWHFYGSTEMFSIAVGKVTEPPRAGERLPVGQVFPEVTLLFVDENGDEVPAGSSGEMLASSPWVAAEYYRDPARTEASWVVDPLGRGTQQRFYRAGDLGYLRPDGRLIVLGRRDAQIKHMGYRMELGEVEEALRSLPELSEGCILYDAAAGKIWCFYTGSLNEKEMRKALLARLARYMLPDVFVRLTEMPHTASMKLDRAALKQMMAQ